MLQDVTDLVSRQSSVGDVVCLLPDFDFCDCFTLKICNFGVYVSFFVFFDDCFSFLLF